MKKILLLFCLLLSLQLNAQIPGDHQLSINSEGISEVTPDIIKVSLTLYGNVYGKNPQDLAIKVTDKAIEDLGVKGAAHFEPASQEAVDYGYAYTVEEQTPYPFSRIYTITFSKIEDYTKLADAAARYHQNGINASCAISFVGLDEKTAGPARIAAFQKAIEQAKTKAAIVSQVLGTQVGEVLSVTESMGNYENNLSDTYYNYYTPGKPLKIPYTSYTTVVFRIN